MSPNGCAERRALGCLGLALYRPRVRLSERLGREPEQDSSIELSNGHSAFLVGGDGKKFSFRGRGECGRSQTTINDL